MPQKSSVLMVTWDGAGNLPPERSLVRALVRRGHRVRALAHESIRATLEHDGVECLALPDLRHYDSKDPMSPEDEMRFVVEHIWYARPFGTGLSAAIDRFSPDLLLIDFVLAHALVAARRSGLPTVALCHTPYHLLVGPFAPLFASMLPEANAYAATLGLPPFPSHQALVESASLVLVASYHPFDEVEETAPNVVHVGPCRSSDERHDVWRRRMPQRPLVVVGLSTSHQQQVPLLQRLCDALGALEIEVLVTTGAAIAPELLTPAANTTLVRFLPHELVLPETDLLVTHAGHGTVMAGATHGVPMLCFPMGRDQPTIADRVVRLGLGVAMDPEAPTAEIRRAVATSIADLRMRARARDFATSLRGHLGLEDAVGMVERLVARR